MLREDLIIRKSFSISHNNGEIWAEDLDSLYKFNDIVESKFLEDMTTIKRPSSPSAIAINLNQTSIAQNTGTLIVENLISAGSNVRRVAFVGLDKEGLKIMKKAFQTHEVSFVYKYFDDFVKAKDWLV